jgi:amino acid transporter
MVLAFITYGGWNDAVYLTAEMRDRRRNIPLALLLGTAAVTVLYLLVNLAFVWGLGFDRAAASGAIAADLVARAWGQTGQQVISVLVMVSALAAVNGLVMAGSRLYAAVGADHPVFARLGRWHPRLEVPLTALIVQAAIAGGMILLVGTPAGRQAFGSALVAVGLTAPDWEGRGGFDLLLRCSAPVFWMFFLLTALSLFVLRWKDRGIDRPFTVPVYPLTPLVFAATCGYMLYSGIDYAGTLGLLGGAILVAGLPVYWASQRRAVRLAALAPRVSSPTP